MSTDVVQTLVQNHERFLRFLESRVKSREEAEDILQAAFARSLERADELQKESPVAWFYRVLRNALVDRYRRRDVEARAIERKSTEPSSDPELERTVCECVKDLVKTLKPEYADIVTRIDLEGSTIADLARKENITPNNAMVRLHRARKALHEQLVKSCGTCTRHGCLDCTCRG